MTSTLIGRYVKSANLAGINAEKPLIIDRQAADEVRLLKQFARHYVIGLPALHAQQMGQKRVVRELFEAFLELGGSGRLEAFPARLRYIWEDYEEDSPARRAADCVATLTENEAYRLHQRLTGSDSGTVLDPIVR